VPKEGDSVTSKNGGKKENEKRGPFFPEEEQQLRRMKEGSSKNRGRVS